MSFQKRFHLGRFFVRSSRRWYSRALLRSLIEPLRTHNHRQRCQPCLLRNFATDKDDNMLKLRNLPPIRDHFDDNQLSSSDYWDYSTAYGPSKWADKWPVGNNQSPIHIQAEAVSYNPSLKEDELNFDTVCPFQVKLSNSGLTVRCHPHQESSIPYIFSGPLDCNFEFVELHFHWGKTDCHGSEHVVNDRRYPAEAHLVHWNKSLYKDFEEARSRPNGLAVLGVFLELSSGGSSHMEAFTNTFSKILYKDSAAVLEKPFNPYFLAPLHSLDYWTYKGSLTTPPCTENVTWILFRDPYPMTSEQLQRFRSLMAVKYEDRNEHMFHNPMGSGCSLISTRPPSIGGNFRAVMPVNGRKIQASFK